MNANLTAAIVKALDKPMTFKALTKVCGLGPYGLRRTLDRLIADGVVSARVSKGVRGWYSLTGKELHTGHYEHRQLERAAAGLSASHG